MRQETSVWQKTVWLQGMVNKENNRITQKKKDDNSIETLRYLVTMDADARSLGCLSMGQYRRPAWFGNRISGRTEGRGDPMLPGQCSRYITSRYGTPELEKDGARERKTWAPLEEVTEELDRLEAFSQATEGKLRSPWRGNNSKGQEDNLRANLTLIASSVRAVPIQNFLTEETRVKVVMRRKKKTGNTRVSGRCYKL